MTAPSPQPLTIYHNPQCSSSQHSVQAADELGVACTVVQYLKTPPSRAELRSLLDRFDGEPTELVRRDANFARLGLRDDQVATAEQVIEVLGAHPELLQRPLLVTAERVVIGRPKEAATALLADLAKK